VSQGVGLPLNQQLIGQVRRFEHLEHEIATLHEQIDMLQRSAKQNADTRPLDNATVSQLPPTKSSGNLESSANLASPSCTASALSDVWSEGNAFIGVQHNQGRYSTSHNFRLSIWRTEDFVAQGIVTEQEAVNSFSEFFHGCVSVDASDHDS